MSEISWLLDRFQQFGDKDAIVWRDKAESYRELSKAIAQAHQELTLRGLGCGSTFLLDADFSPRSIALLLAGWQLGCIIVPLAAHVTRIDRPRIAELCGASWHLHLDPTERLQATPLVPQPTPELLQELANTCSPGLVLFTSGSSGEPKGVVHNVSSLLKKFQTPRHRQRLLTFLLFDHIGGMNTLLYALSNGGCAVSVENREPLTVCRTIQDHRVEVLPTSPTFLNLLLLSGRHLEFDLSSLKLINYATETMPQGLLNRLVQTFPGVEFRQSYGMSELGILRSKSKGNDSCWVKVGGEGFETRIVDGMIQIKAESSMLGYLNAPSPFTNDGWFITQDEVEVDGEWIRIKGRKSDLINVGGEKVFPSEIESVLMDAWNVADAVVGREPHPIIGNIVTARVQLIQDEPRQGAITRLRKHCFERLPPYKVPVKIQIETELPVSDRFKKERRNEQ